MTSLQQTVHLASCAVFFALGLLVLTDRSSSFAIKSYISLLVVLPFSGVFSAYWYRSGVASFDLFWAGVAISAVARSAVLRIATPSVRFAALVVTVSTVHLALTLDHLPIARMTDVLKDMKPIVIVLVATIGLSSRVARNLLWDRRWFNTLMRLAGLKTALLFVAISQFGLSAVVTTDPFFAEEMAERLRYADFAALYAVLWIALSRGQQWRVKLIDLAVALGIVLVSGYRTLLVLALVLCLLPLGRRAHMPMVVAGMVVVAASLPLVMERSIAGLSLDVIAADFANRVSPFLDAMQDFRNAADWIGGLGLGYAFYIPWFEYRATVDPWNHFVDSLYLTLFAKYGLLCLAILGPAIVLAVSNARQNPTVTLVVGSLLALGVTHSVVYQQGFGLVVCLLACVIKSRIQVRCEVMPLQRGEISSELKYG